MFWQFGVIFLMLAVLIICIAIREDYYVQKQEGKIHAAALQPPARYRMVKLRNVWTPRRGG